VSLYHHRYSHIQFVLLHLVEASKTNLLRKDCAHYWREQRHRRESCQKICGVRSKESCDRCKEGAGDGESEERVQRPKQDKHLRDRFK
jgi:hypothetical protein